MKFKKVICLLMAVMVVLVAGGCGDKKSSEKKSVSKNPYDGKTIKQMLEDENFEISGAGIFNDVISVDFKDENNIQITAEIKVSSKQMSEFEEIFDNHRSLYKNHIRDNMADCKISNCQYAIYEKEALDALVAKGNAEKNDSMAGKSFWDLAEEGCKWESLAKIMSEYLITMYDKDNNYWYMVVDASDIDFEIDKEIYENKDERLKDVKIAEAYKIY